MSLPAIPVTVVTGFLGAGKSTLVQSWLEQLGEQTTVIINERGAVGIDGELLAARIARLREITGGCACCQTQAQLVSALRELSEAQPHPTRILIETSGAASPAGIISAITAPRTGTRLQLDGVIAVVDVTRVAQALAFDLGIEQLGFSDIVVLSHVDRAEQTSRVDLDAVQAQVLRHAPAAVVAQARRGVVTASFSELLARRVEAFHAWPESSTHASIDAAAMVIQGELDEDRFGDWVELTLASAAARILRIKGILALKGVDARVIVQGVGEAVEVQLGALWGDAERTSRLVVLGLGLDVPALEAGFSNCRVNPSN
jgi:G3E family GTPase